LIISLIRPGQVYDGFKITENLGAMTDLSIIHVLDYFFLPKRSVPTANAYEYSLIYYEFYLDMVIRIGDLRRVCFQANSGQ